MSEGPGSVVEGGAAVYKFVSCLRVIFSPRPRALVSATKKRASTVPTSGRNEVFVFIVFSAFSPGHTERWRARQPHKRDQDNPQRRLCARDNVRLLQISTGRRTNTLLSPWLLQVLPAPISAGRFRARRNVHWQLSLGWKLQALFFSACYDPGTSH
jgi:hypothetical protein